jgi:D-alanyl-D-alanine dipeptidase
MTRRSALALLSAGISLPCHAAPSSRDPALKPLRSCRQLLRVETAGWKATSGVFTLWTREKSGAPWQPDGPAIPVLVGRAGMRWGRGLHRVPPGGVLKREGDLCTPAGIFSLDTAFGSMTAQQAGVSRWPWQQMTPSHAGVDDARSRFYNRVVDASCVKKDWTSAENMMPKNGAYRCGLIVRHNWDRQPGAGSCIFLHIRTSRPTVGCTSMSAASLLRVLRWLDTSKNPLLIQLPKAEWQIHGPAWGVPVSASTARKPKTAR